MIVAPSIVVPTGLMAHAWLAHERACNSGGPASRTRTEHVSSTVLGDETGPIRCPRVLRVGLAFGRRKPVACAERWLRDAGFASELDARAAFALPDRPCICQPDPSPQPYDAAMLSARDGLFFALVLGLSTTTVYDPSRPLIWTTASLTRQLVLFDGGGFYA